MVAQISGRKKSLLKNQKGTAEKSNQVISSILQSKEEKPHYWHPTVQSGMSSSLFNAFH